MGPRLLYSIILSLVAIPLTAKYVTLNDRECQFYVKFCSCAGMSRIFPWIFENNCVKNNTGRLMSAAEMFSMDFIVSGDILFMRIFAGGSQFLSKFSLDLRMPVSRYAVRVVLQTTVLKTAILLHGKFQIICQGAAVPKRSVDCGN